MGLPHLLSVGYSPNAIEGLGGAGAPIANSCFSNSKVYFLENSRGLGVVAVSLQRINVKPHCK